MMYKLLFFVTFISICYISAYAQTENLANFSLRNTSLSLNKSKFFDFLCLSSSRMWQFLQECCVSIARPKGWDRGCTLCFLKCVLNICPISLEFVFLCLKIDLVLSKVVWWTIESYEASHFYRSITIRINKASASRKQ